MTYLEIFPAGPPTPTDNCVFVLRTVKKILITAISENSSFLAKSLNPGDCNYCPEAVTEHFSVKLTRVYVHNKPTFSSYISQMQHPVVFGDVWLTMRYDISIMNHHSKDIAFIMPFYLQQNLGGFHPVPQSPLTQALGQGMVLTDDLMPFSGLEQAITNSTLHVVRLVTSHCHVNLWDASSRPSLILHSKW